MAPMEGHIEAKVPPQVVWQAWEAAHEKHGQGGLKAGQRGETKAEGASRFRYQILHAIPGKEFEILWKTLFVRLIFKHVVEPAPRGCRITYSVQIKGPFSWLVRALLGNKIRSNIGAVLKAVVQQLERSTNTN
jgi:hypothetical protein